MRSGRPLVRVKLAMSLDGRTALASGASRWITGEAARADVQHWRARSSAVLTGVGTVLADDPRLDVRLPDETRARSGVSRCAWCSTPRCAPRRPSRLFGGGGEVLIFTAVTAADDPRAAAWRRAARGSSRCRLTRGALALPAVLDRLAELEMNEVLVEAGATLAGELLRQGLVDELLLYVGAAAARAGCARAGVAARR